MAVGCLAVIKLNARTRFESLVQRINELRPKKPNTNEFVESGLENWVLMN